MKNICSVFFASLCVCLNFVYAQSHLGPFQEQPKSLNPLRLPIDFHDRHPTPVVLDVNKDGLLDLVVATYNKLDFYDPQLLFVKNTGTVTNPVFEQTSSGNPFLIITPPTSASYGTGPTPAFSDLDKDGDTDIIFGTETGSLFYVKDVNAYPGFPYAYQSGSANPFDGVDLGAWASPAFNDMDNDGDDDLIIGCSYLPNNQSIHYYVNNGDETFTAQTLTGINPNVEAATPTFIDVDNDGQKDIVIGDLAGKLYYFRRTGLTSFEEQTGAANPFNGVDKGSHASPTAADFDNDGDMDLVVGAILTKSTDLSYFQNNGNSIFVEQVGFKNPLGGLVLQGNDAESIFTDVDNDGKTDLILADQLTSSTKIRYFKKTDDSFEEQFDAANPFNTIIASADFTPSFVDIDGDGDKDLLGGGSTASGQDAIGYFKNNNGTFEKQDFASGPFKNIVISKGKTDFVDVDADGDIDLFISEFNASTEVSIIHYFKNTGSATTPVFTEQSGNDNPLSSVQDTNLLFPRFFDLDHDGDYDAFIGITKSSMEGNPSGEINFYENTGTASQPVFTLKTELDFGNIPPYPTASFFDYDNDGDFDFFVGSGSMFEYYRNNNIAPVSALTPTEITVNAGEETVLAPDYTITDSENDMMVKAIIRINDYVQGEYLTVSLPEGITADFNEGELVIAGKASLDIYQALLRSVKAGYDITRTSKEGRVKSSTKVAEIVSQTVTWTVYDEDFTTPESITSNLDLNTVESSLIVYNAVAPNSTGDNKFMRIMNLPEANSITIFNRWGDEVYKADNYNHEIPGKRFEGNNKNGKALPSGTYFYKIEYSGKTKTGYLSLVQ